MIALTMLFMLALALWGIMRDRHVEKNTLMGEADAGIRQIRRGARKRAVAASVPMPMHFEHTPVHGTPIPVSGFTSRVPMVQAPDRQQALEYLVKNTTTPTQGADIEQVTKAARAATSQPYHVTTRRTAPQGIPVLPQYVRKAPKPPLPRDDSPEAKALRVQRQEQRRTRRFTKK